jgi:hypothetical protein
MQQKALFFKKIEAKNRFHQFGNCAASAFAASIRAPFSVHNFLIFAAFFAGWLLYPFVCSFVEKEESLW